MHAHATIIGAGPVGTLLALLLARRGQSVRILERRSDPRHSAIEQGRSINLALAARGIRALERAGVMTRIAPQMLAMAGRMLHDEHGVASFMPYGQNETEIIYAISRARLNQALIEVAAESERIELRFEQRCVDVDPSSGTLQLRDERDGEMRTESFTVLYGTDGYSSAVRAALCTHGYCHSQEAPLDHDYKELNIPARHGEFALPSQALHIWPRQRFMLIALPNTDHSFTATLFLARHGCLSFEHLHSAGAVRELFSAEFPDASALMPALTDEFRDHPQARLGAIRCDPWHVRDRVLLLGDAAHAIVPFHGQGLNCGFEDCVLLDELLASASSRAAAFEQFEQRRRPDAEAIAAMALENYLEMRAAVRTPEFAQRRALAGALERAYPGRFIPRYSMVMFHPEISYSEAQRRGARQEQILDALLADPAHNDPAGARAQALLRDAQL